MLCVRKAKQEFLAVDGSGCARREEVGKEWEGALFLTQQAGMVGAEGPWVASCSEKWWKPHPWIHSKSD